MMRTSTGVARWLLRGVALVGLSGLLVVAADRLVGSLRADVQAVLGRPAPAPAAALAEPIQVAQAERR